MKLSCTDVMVPGASLEEKARKLRKWGYEGIAVFYDYKTWSTHKLEEIQNVMDLTGINVCEFVFIDQLYGHLMDANLGIRQQARQMYKDAIEVCNHLGAITEMEFDYGVQDPLPLFEPYKKMLPDEEAEFIQLIKELASVTKTGSSYILVEPVNRYETKYLTTLRDCKEILDKAGQPNTGILADFFHLSIEESNLPNSIRKTDGAIKHVHLGDSNRLLPGNGHTDWEECFRALKDVGFDGFLNLECAILGDAEVELPKTANFLKSIIEKI